MSEPRNVTLQIGRGGGLSLRVNDSYMSHTMESLVVSELQHVTALPAARIDANVTAPATHAPGLPRPATSPAGSPRSSRRTKSGSDRAARRAGHPQHPPRRMVRRPVTAGGARAVTGPSRRTATVRQVCDDWRASAHIRRLVREHRRNERDRADHPPRKVAALVVAGQAIIPDALPSQEQATVKGDVPVRARDSRRATPRPLQRTRRRSRTRTPPAAKRN